MTYFEAPVTVLYIVGSGRSGSTLLDIVLGNHPDIQSTGELTNLTNTGWISQESLRGVAKEKLRSPLCACGKRIDVSNVPVGVETCPFWSDVRREWIALANQDDIESYPGLQEAFEGIKRWPRLLLEKYRPSPQFQSYARLTRALFKSISVVSGKSVVVDSSKNPQRAFALTMSPGIDLRLVHLVRDARGVISSRRKTFKKDVDAGIGWDHNARPVWRSGLHWVHVNLRSELVRAQLGPGRSERLRYEDYLENTNKALTEIGGLVGLDLTSVADAASSGKPMQVGHVASGNRLRMSQSIQLQPDKGEWRNVLSAEEQRLSWMLAGWLMRRYGYKRACPAL